MSSVLQGGGMAKRPLRIPIRGYETAWRLVPSRQAIVTNPYKGLWARILIREKLKKKGYESL